MKNTVVLGTATPEGGFPAYGAALAATIAGVEYAARPLAERTATGAPCWGGTGGRSRPEAEMREKLSAMPIINVHNLSKQFEDFTAVDRISFSVDAGELFGLLGPNGAGKTTTINILCTLLSATSGSAEIAGFDCSKQSDRVRSHIGLIFQDTTLDLELTAYENLKWGYPLDSTSPKG